MLSLRVDPDFNGPSLKEMIPLLGDTAGPVEVAWENSRIEAALVNRFRDCDLVLVVPTLAAMEQAAATLGIAYAFDRRMKFSASEALNSNEVADWRPFVSRMGSSVTRGLMLGLVGESVRMGIKVPALQAVVDWCVFDNVSPADSDVLLGLWSAVGESR